MNNLELEYAGFWIRVWATIIDTFLLLMITVPLLHTFYGESYWVSEKIFAGPADLFLSYVFPFIAVMLFWLKKQATPGKIATFIKIVDSKTGKAPSISQFVIRYIGYFLAMLPLGLGLLWVAFDDRKQGWHDKLSGTVVVRQRNRGPKPVTFN